MVATLTATEQAIRLDRAPLQAALKRVNNVVPTRSTKTILQCVRLEAARGSLRVSATDCDVSVSMTVECEGELSPCVVNARELVQRINASKNPRCSLHYDEEHATVVLNGGRVEHAIRMAAVEEFPFVPCHPVGRSIQIPASALLHALKTCSSTAARESTRYAINGVLLESDGKGVRLVATDGRRMSVVEANGATGAYSGSVILPLRFASLVARFVGPKCADAIEVFVDEQPASEGQEAKPARVYVCGANWMLTSDAAEGTFPRYRDVIPPAGSKFNVNRGELINLVSEVSIAADSANQSVLLRFSKSSLRVSTASPGSGESSGSMEAVFEGGGDEAVIIGVNPAYLTDAIKSLAGDEVVFDLRQNTLCERSNAVKSSPLCVRERYSESTVHVIMPVNLGLPPSLESLGSNCAALVTQ
ncbi:MAG TPA: DNA polymerase III subunit beta [Phycisphaerae bacterium]|nr:DNA polymerase III subunit beta [Phycisphaerae bacterium]